MKTLHDKWVDFDKDQGTARAFARAIAATRTTCNAKGNAYGCASAYAFSQAWAKATAKATARAWATAIAKCKCNRKFQVNAAQSDVWAREHKKLIAKVKAVASSSVCSKGGFKSTSDAQTCLQDVYAWVYAQVRTLPLPRDLWPGLRLRLQSDAVVSRARVLTTSRHPVQAIAKAAIKGKCVSLKGKKSSLSYGKFTAKALADAQATIRISTISGCKAGVHKG